MPRRAILLLACFSVLCSASDLKYTRKTKDNAGEHGDVVYYYQGQRIRIDSRNEVGFNWKNGKPESVAYGPRTATIFQCDMHRVLRLDFDHHQYTVTDLDANGTPIDPDAAATMKRSGAKVRIIVEARDTGETKQIYGMTARRYLVTRKGIPGPGACMKPFETTADGWFVDIPQPKPQGCGQLPTPPAGAIPAVAFLASSSCGMDEQEVEHVGPQPPPFAIELDYSNRPAGTPNARITDTVTDLSRLPLDPQLFDLPTGYKHVDKLDESPNLPWLLRGKLMWQSVKSTVWSWTPWGK